MIQHQPRRIALAALAVLAGLVPEPAAAAFPDIGEKEQALQEVPGTPEAVAVVLQNRGELWLMDQTNLRMSSTLRIFRRIKVLTDAGAEEYGEITIPHSRDWRLSGFSGRTVLPDGRELKVGDDAVFRRRTSRLERVMETAVAFPSVAPGAILDMEFDLNFDHVFVLDPWFFQAPIPTLHAEIEVHIPDTLEVSAWGFSLPGKDFQSEVHNEKGGRRMRVWLDDLPPIPDETYGPPEQDLSAKFMLVPRALHTQGTSLPLMASWKDVCQLVDDIYEEAGLESRAVKAKAKELGGGGKGDRRATAEAIYRFVRDEIDTGSGYSIFVSQDSRLAKVLDEGRGSMAEKALLLHGLLGAADFSSQLLWVPDRWEGTIDPELPNPGWFDRLMVRLEVPGAEGAEHVVLDPSDRTLGFGFLAPQHEGVQALIFDKKNPEILPIPESPAQASRRLARIDLSLDDEGRMIGKGTLELTGHHAWRQLEIADGEEETREHWETWLEEHWPGWMVSEVAVDERVDERRVEVRWALEQREEEVLGDEASLQPSRPLGPIRQLFQVDAEQRRTPVLLPFADVDEVQLELSWGDGWLVEVAPKPLRRPTPLGLAESQVEVDDENRRLTYSRRLEVSRRYITGTHDYAALRTLFDVLEKHDAQAFVLVAE